MFKNIISLSINITSISKSKQHGSRSYMLNTFTFFSTNSPSAATSTAANSSNSASIYSPSEKVFGMFKVVIVGRPNVGKSSIFNRLIRKNEAIVSPIPGTTRDRREGVAQIGSLSFQVVDTGGLDLTKDNHGINQSMLLQTEHAIDEADAVLFCISARDGVTPDDEYFARWLRRRQKQLQNQKKLPVFLIANKADGNYSEIASSIQDQDERASVNEDGTLSDEYFKWRNFHISCKKLGFGQPIPFSASHNYGISDLYTVLEPIGLIEDEAAKKAVQLREEEKEKESSMDGDALHKKIKIALIGRPNVGKSSVLNSIVGKSRVITGPMPGLTRDAISVNWNYNGKDIELVDTAGIRKQGRLYLEAKKLDSAAKSDKKISQAEKLDFKTRQVLLEGLSVESSLRALAFSHIVLVVVDLLASEDSSSDGLSAGISKQDISIIEKVANEGRGLVLIANKIDRVRKLMSRTELREKGYVFADRLNQHSKKSSNNAQNEGIGNLPADQVKPLTDEDLKNLHSQLQQFIANTTPQIQNCPIILTSTVEKLGVNDIMPSVLKTYEKWTKRITTAKLVRWVIDTTSSKPPPKQPIRRTGNAGGRLRSQGMTRKAVMTKGPVKIKYMTQVSTCPPTFAVFVNRNNPESVIDDRYQRFLTNKLKKDFDLEGIPIRLLIRGSKNPFVRGSSSH